MSERDPFLRRFERDAILSCGVLAGIALALPGGGPWMAVAVLGGGGLAAASYRAIKGAVDAVAGGGRRTAALVKFFTRHGMLAIAAYVMLVRLRLHPVGVLMGASSLFVAAAVAAARSLLPASRSGPPGS